MKAMAESKALSILPLAIDLSAAATLARVAIKEGFSHLSSTGCLMDSKYLGMTLNERLYVSGLMDEFDRAVKEYDVVHVRDILNRVELSEDSILPILKQLGL